MTAPETLEELRQAVRDVLATTVPDPDGKAQTAESALREIAALLPPAPEPIKVGDRVRAEHDPSFEGDVLGGPWDDNGDPTVCVGSDNAMGLELVRADDLARVDSSPSPEPETGHAFVGVNGHPDDDECTYRVDGTDDTYCGRTAAEHRDPHCTICGVGSDPGGDHVACRSDPTPASPSPEVGEGVEPHESEDPEELAAGVPAGLRVNPRPPGADWRDRQTYDGTVSAFREALDYGFRYRIWGTVPGYGETGGAS